MKNKLIAIIGPTSSGKSDLGIYLAKQFAGEIVSVDSRQVYKGMDIGSGKVAGKLNKQKCINITLSQNKKNICPFISDDINHWMIDIANPKTDYLSAAEFQDMAYQVIFSLFTQKKLPILVGGTAMYMDAILKGYQFPKTSIKLRKELEKFDRRKLLDELKKNDPISYEKIDRNNLRRVIRALESYLVNQDSHLSYKVKKPNFKFLIIGINWDRALLYKRIDQRVDQRIKEGMIEEVAKLHRDGISYEKLESFGLEYRHISQYLQGKIARNEMIQILKFKIHAFARRQLTWWRKNKNIAWLNFQKPADKNQIYAEAKEIAERFIKN